MKIKRLLIFLLSYALLFPSYSLSFSLVPDEIENALKYLDLERSTSLINSYQQMCHMNGEKNEIINQDHYRNICELMMSTSCSDISKEKRTNCNDFNQNEIDTTSWYFIKNCTAGLWESIKDLILFLKDAIVWTVENFDSETRSERVDTAKDFYNSIANYLSIEFEKEMEVHKGEDYQKIKASYAVFENIFSKTLKAISKIIQTEYIKLGCFNPQERSERICKAIGDLTMPPAFAIGLITKGSSLLRKTKKIAWITKDKPLPAPPKIERLEIKAEKTREISVHSDKNLEKENRQSHESVFLHKRDDKLHLYKPVEAHQRLKRIKGEATSQKPTQKIDQWLDALEKGKENPKVISKIKKHYLNNFTIKKDEVPESYFNFQRRVHEEQGISLDIDERMKRELIENVIKDQKESLSPWADYLTSKDTDMYPQWAKFWAMEGMVKLSKFDKKKKKFAQRRPGDINAFPELNREALGFVMDAIIKKVGKKSLDEIENPEFIKLLEGENFGKLYAHALSKLGNNATNLSITKGKWVKYPQGSDHMPLVKSLEGKNTGWCTAASGTAEKQVQGGDFYVYYSYDDLGRLTNPRLAIRMNGNKQIGEIRGIGDNQNFDEVIAQTDILDEKLKEFGNEADKYYKKSSDMKRLTEIKKKHDKNEELSLDDLRFLYEIDNKIEGFGYEKDPRIEKIISTRNKREDIAKALNVKEAEVSFTQEEALKGGVKFHYGDLDLSGLTSAENLKLPESIRGSLYLKNLTSAENLKLPESVGGNLNLSNLTSAENLKFPKIVGGDLNLSNLISAKNLKLPESVEGHVYLDGLESAEDLNIPENLKGNLNLRGLASAKNLKLPKSVGGNLDLSGLTSAKDLKLPESVGGDLILGSLISAKNLKLPESVGGGLNLWSLTRAKDLKLPKSVGGSLYLSGLTGAKDLKLPESVGGDLVLRSLISAENLKLPESVGGDLNLWNLTRVKNLKLPESVGGNIFIKNKLFRGECRFFCINNFV